MNSKNSNNILYLKCYSKYAIDILQVVLAYIKNSIDASTSKEAAVIMHDHIAKNLIDKICQDDEIAPDGEIIAKLNVNNSYYDQWLLTDRLKTLLLDSIGDALDKFIKFSKMYESKDEQIVVMTDDSFRKEKKSTKTIYGALYPADATKLKYYVKMKFNDLLILRDYFQHKSMKAIIEKYNEEAVQRVIGFPRNPLWIEQIRFKNEEFSRIYEEHIAKICELKKEQYRKTEEIENEFKLKIQALKYELDKQIIAIQSKYDEVERQWIEVEENSYKNDEK